MIHRVWFGDQEPSSNDTEGKIKLPANFSKLKAEIVRAGAVRDAQALIDQNYFPGYYVSFADGREFRFNERDSKLLNKVLELIPEENALWCD